jgi:hypothetical protein
MDMSKLVQKDSLRYVEEEETLPPPIYKEDGPPEVLTGDMTRQGPLGKPVLWVLLAGVALACLGFLVAWALSGAPPPH